MPATTAYRYRLLYFWKQNLGELWGMRWSRTYWIFGLVSHCFRAIPILSETFKIIPVSIYLLERFEKALLVSICFRPIRTKGGSIPRNSVDVLPAQTQVQYILDKMITYFEQMSRQLRLRRVNVHRPFRIFAFLGISRKSDVALYWDRSSLVLTLLGVWKWKYMIVCCQGTPMHRTNVFQRARWRPSDTGELRLQIRTPVPEPFDPGGIFRAGGQNFRV